MIDLPSLGNLWARLHVYRGASSNVPPCPYAPDEDDCPLWIDCPPGRFCALTEDKLLARNKEEYTSGIFRNPGWRRSTVVRVLTDADYFEVCDSDALEPGFFCQEERLVRWVDRAGRYHEVQVAAPAAEEPTPRKKREFSAEGDRRTRRWRKKKEKKEFFTDPVVQQKYAENEERECRKHEAERAVEAFRTSREAIREKRARLWQEEKRARAQIHASPFQMTKPGPIWPATIFPHGVRVPSFFRYDEVDDEDEGMDRAAYAMWRRLLRSRPEPRGWAHPHPLVGSRWKRYKHVVEVVAVVDDIWGHVFVRFMADGFHHGSWSVPTWLEWVARAVRLDDAQQRDTASTATEPLGVQHG